jgi:hypothetical protein
MTYSVGIKSERKKPNQMCGKSPAIINAPELNKQFTVGFIDKE